MSSMSAWPTTPRPLPLPESVLPKRGGELLVCYVGAYATSSQALPAVQGAKLPVLVMNFQPVSALDDARTDVH